MSPLRGWDEMRSSFYKHVAPNGASGGNQYSNTPSLHYSILPVQLALLGPLLFEERLQEHAAFILQNSCRNIAMMI